MYIGMYIGSERVKLRYSFLFSLSHNSPYSSLHSFLDSFLHRIFQYGKNLTNVLIKEFKFIKYYIRPSYQYVIDNHRSTKCEVVIVIEIPIVISQIIFGVETESGLGIAPSRQVFE